MVTLHHCRQVLRAAYPLQFRRSLAVTQRTLNHKEQDKIRAARAKFFQQDDKRKHLPGNTQNSNSPSTTEPQPNNDNTTTQPDDMSPSAKRFKFPGITSTAPSKSASKDPLIVRFYDPDIQARDAHGRSQEQILSWSDNELERCHNYIQMLFPVPEGSAFNWEAPVIDCETMEAFQSRSDLRGRLRRSFERMLRFYGFEVTIVAKKKENSKAEDETETEQKSEEVNGGSSEPDSTSKLAHDSNTTKDTDKEPSKPPTPSTSRPGAYTITRAPHWRKAFNTWAVNFDHNHLRITRILRCLRILGLRNECDAFFEALKEVYEDPKIKISERSMSYWTRAVSRPLYIAPDDDWIEWLRVWEEEQGKKAEKEGGGDD